MAEPVRRSSKDGAVVVIWASSAYLTSCAPRWGAHGWKRGVNTVHARAGLLVDLTAELVRRSSKDGAVIVTWASSAYLDFLRNWVHHITSWDDDNILIGEYL
jgi:hypothetical protein